MAGVFVALALGSDGHLNPAVTVGVAVSSGDWSRLSAYVPAQILGAMVGSTLVWLTYWAHWEKTPDTARQIGMFLHNSGHPRTVGESLTEVIGTFVLIFVAAAIASKHGTTTGLSPGLGPFLVGLLVWAIGLSLGGPTGYAINPARDLGPRIMHALLPIAGKGGSDWSYAPIPIVGPIVGATVAGLAVKLFQI